MINIKLDEKTTFSYDAKEKAVYIFDERNQPEAHALGRIQFFDIKQASKFKEILDYMMKDVVKKKQKQLQEKT